VRALPNVTKDFIYATVFQKHQLERVLRNLAMKYLSEIGHLKRGRVE
jgi:hypothetical protein